MQFTFSFDSLFDADGVHGRKCKSLAKIPGSFIRAGAHRQAVEAEVLPETFVRPADFDLAAFWEKWCADYESQPPFVARVRVAPAALPTLSYYLDERGCRLPAMPLPRTPKVGSPSTCHSSRLPQPAPVCLAWAAPWKCSSRSHCGRA